MNPMNVPGFTAALSLCKSSRPYGVTAIFKASERAPKVVPAKSDLGGPIGLPGQDCGEARLHVCMMSGGGGPPRM